MKNILKILLVVIAAVFFSECIDEPVQNENNIISGEIWGGHNNFVSNGFYPIVQSDRRGNFQINIQNKPYELVISGDIYEYYPVLKFTGLTNNKLKIVYGYDRYFPPYTRAQGYDTCKLKVFFPIITGEKRIAAKFISKSDFSEPVGEITCPPGTYFREIYILIPSNTNNINGKIYYLESSLDTLGRRISYDKFGIKEITISKSSNPDIIFTNEELTDPAEYDMQINRNFPLGFGTDIRDIFITDCTKNRSSNLWISMYELYKCKIPILPESVFKIEIDYEYFLINGHYSSGWGYEYVEMGEPANLNYKSTFNIIQPTDGAENITESSKFELTDNDFSAIYEYNIYNSGKNLIFYSTSDKLTFSDFITRGFEFEKNQRYNFFVRKFPNFKSIDEFLSEFYSQVLLDYIELSKPRTFKTAP